MIWGYYPCLNGMSRIFARCPMLSGKVSGPSARKCRGCRPAPVRGMAEMSSCLKHTTLRVVPIVVYGNNHNDDDDDDDDDDNEEEYYDERPVNEQQPLHILAFWKQGSHLSLSHHCCISDLEDMLDSSTNTHKHDHSLRLMFDYSTTTRVQMHHIETPVWDQSSSLVGGFYVSTSPKSQRLCVAMHRPACCWVSSAPKSRGWIPWKVPFCVDEMSNKQPWFTGFTGYIMVYPH